MKLRAAAGWQTVLADLALILFVSSTAALSVREQASDDLSAYEAPMPWHVSHNMPSAIYAAVPDAPPFDEWLRGSARDPREKLTIAATYAPGDRSAVAQDALSFSQQAASQGFAATIILQSGDRSRVAARFAFDGASNGT